MNLLPTRFDCSDGPNDFRDWVSEKHRLGNLLNDSKIKKKKIILQSNNSIRRFFCQFIYSSNKNFK